MRVDDRKRKALKTAFFQSIPLWVILVLGMIYVSISEPNNSGMSDFSMLLIECGIALFLLLVIYLTFLYELLKAQDD